MPSRVHLNAGTYVDVTLDLDHVRELIEVRGEDFVHARATSGHEVEFRASAVILIEQVPAAEWDAA